MNNINDNENIEEENKEEEPLAILNLEIEKGIVKQIKLYKNSNPEEVSFAFCKENNIDFSLMSQIKNEIETLLQNYFQSSHNENQKEDNISPNDENEYIQNNPNNIINENNNNSLNDDEYNNYHYINQFKNNIPNKDNDNINNRKLFFYQFLQEQKNQKLINNKSNSANKYRLNVFNTLKNTKKKYKNKNNFIENKNSKYINDSYLTKNFNTIANNNNSNIFNRLYNDAKIKRVVYKRPCHYGSHSKENNNIFQDDIDDVYETINGKTINKKTLDMNPSYSRSYQIKPNQLLSKECSFQPNTIIHNQQTNNISYNLNNTYNSNNDNIDDIHLYYNNNLNFNKKKNKVLYEENYIPLKNKTKYYSNIDRNNNMNFLDNIDIVTKNAFNNLFNILINNDTNQILNKNTITMNNIDKNTVLILSSIIQDINSNELELNLDNFINKLNNEISNDDKKYLISNYSDISINNNMENKERYSNMKSNIKNKKYDFNSNSKNIKNKNKEMTFFSYNKNHRLPSGTEKKKNFYYL